MGLKHVNMNWNDNVHKCENFVMDFWLLSFVIRLITWWIWLPKNLFLDNGGWILVLHSCFLSPAAPKARDGRYCNAPRLSVRLSVMFSFRTVTQKTHRCIFSKLCRYVHHVMEVCCIVFDIDGMLFEFFMNFLNIEKNKI